ncbi:MAG: alpha/beta fold hydrolase [FCB group bacterium]|nr:alpha/beta fold hydrolase [FCB group bacterium]
MWFIVFTILLHLLVIFPVILYRKMSKVYLNERVPHSKTPAELKIPFSEIRIPTKNDKSLYAWWIPVNELTAESFPTLILVHGWNRNVERLLVYIRELYGRGFNLIAFDARHHGSSDTDEYASMPKFAEDIQSVIDYLQDELHSGLDGLAVVGLSIGGAASIYAASQDFRIKKVVTVGAFAHPEDVMRSEFRKHYIPYFPLVWLLFRKMQKVIGLTFEKVAPVNNIHNSPADFLIIHGEKDDVVPAGDAHRLAAAGNPKRVSVWIIAGRGHSDCHREFGFWDRILNFLKK